LAVSAGGIAQVVEYLSWQAGDPEFKPQNCQKFDSFPYKSLTITMENKSKLIYSLALKFNRFKMFLSDSLLPR
jgi:hypothetical protein